MNNLQNSPALMLALTAAVFVQLIALVLIVDRSKREIIRRLLSEFRRGWADANRQTRGTKEKRAIDREFYEFTKKVDKQSGRIF